MPPVDTGEEMSAISRLEASTATPVSMRFAGLRDELDEAAAPPIDFARFAEMMAPPAGPSAPDAEPAAFYGIAGGRHGASHLAPMPSMSA